MCGTTSEGIDALLRRLVALHHGWLLVVPLLRLLVSRLHKLLLLGKLLQIIGHRQQRYNRVARSTYARLHRLEAAVSRDRPLTDAASPLMLTAHGTQRNTEQLKHLLVLDRLDGYVVAPAH